MKKAMLFVFGVILIIGTLAGDNLKYIGDWSTGELVGYNSWTVFALVGGPIFIYFSFKSDKKKDNTSSK